MLHQTIKNDIIAALRSKDTIRLEVLRGLSALITNEMLSSKTESEFLPDDKVLALVKRSAKQRKDSIEQFEKGGRIDLAQKEKSELAILNSFLPTLMTREEVKLIAHQRIDALKSSGGFDPKAGGKITGMIMKELAGKADGADVKAVVEELLKS
ncbi:MAG: GatB/YqeY domain-containing protein [Patescibacteria group bacterium]